jgi:hypothetical protein
MSVVASSAFLHQLYNSLCSNSVQSRVMQFLNHPGSSSDYTNMAHAINSWIQSANSSTVIPGLRVFVIDPNGATTYDSNAGVNNIHSNINKPALDFLTTGKYMINENLGARSYIMGAALSQSGVFSQTKYSNTANKKLLYLAIRQGLSSAEPHGFIVLAMDA